MIGVLFIWWLSNKRMHYKWEFMMLIKKTVSTIISESLRRGKKIKLLFQHNI